LVAVVQLVASRVMWMVKDVPLERDDKHSTRVSVD
jgi:hypothetical protein